MQILTLSHFGSWNKSLWMFFFSDKTMYSPKKIKLGYSPKPNYNNIYASLHHPNIIFFSLLHSFSCLFWLWKHLKLQTKIHRKHHKITMFRRSPNLHPKTHPGPLPCQCTRRHWATPSEILFDLRAARAARVWCCLTYVPYRPLGGKFWTLFVNCQLF